MYISSGLSNERSHADIGVHDDSVMMRADAHSHTPTPTATDFSGHLGAFDADAGAAGHMVKAFGDGAVAADGDGIDGGTQVVVDVGPIEYLNGAPGAARDAGEAANSEASDVIVEIGPIEVMSGMPGEAPAGDAGDGGTDLSVEVGQIEITYPGDDQNTNTSTDGKSTDAGTSDSHDNNGDSHDKDDSDHKDANDTHDDTKVDDPGKGDMPNPDGGPASPTSTPNPDGDDDGTEGSHHGASGGHLVGSGGGGDGEGESPGHRLSEKLAGGGENQQGSSGGGAHGPLDPGEEMPNPEAGGGSPSSIGAHGAHSFWDQAAAATQGATGGEHLSTSGAFEHAAAGAVAFNAAITGSAHDISGALSGTTAHAGEHDAAVGHADLHAEHTGLGTTTLHDQLALGGGSFAHQMHV
jgi:hypothetical protein